MSYDLNPAPSSVVPQSATGKLLLKNDDTMTATATLYQYDSDWAWQKKGGPELAGSCWICDSTCVNAKDVWMTQCQQAWIWYVPRYTGHFHTFLVFLWSFLWAWWFILGALWQWNNCCHPFFPQHSPAILDPQRAHYVVRDIGTGRIFPLGKWFITIAMKSIHL